MGNSPSNSDLYFQDLLIEGFRGFRNLSISQLGRVTLITGENNTGKTSVLEALRLHTQNSAPSAIYSILESREEYLRKFSDTQLVSEAEGDFHVSALFHGYPGLLEESGTIKISTGGNGPSPRKLTLKVDWLGEEIDTQGNRVLVAAAENSMGKSDLVPTLVAITEETEYRWRLEGLAQHSRRLSRLPHPHSVRMPCAVVSANGRAETETLGNLWDAIALTDSESEVVNALRIIDPSISAVSMVGGDSRYSSKTAIVRSDHFSRPVQLRSFGDGLNRVFTIVLSLLNAQGGILLVDEFENGLHHTVQLDAWRMIFKLARSLDVQVFATSHSWDAVEAFQKAAAETPVVGVLMRLIRRGGDVFATSFSEDNLRVATREKIEVR